MEISDELFKKVVLKAFSLGVAWAEVYISWFEPSKEDNDKNKMEAIRKCRRLLTRALKPTT